jgi:hypothetical protein
MALQSLISYFVPASRLKREARRLMMVPILPRSSLMVPILAP